MPRLNADLAEHAEKFFVFFSAVAAVSAVNGFFTDAYLTNVGRRTQHLSKSRRVDVGAAHDTHDLLARQLIAELHRGHERRRDRKSTRLNSSHTVISYAVFCLKKKKIKCTTCQKARPIIYHTHRV